MDYREKYTGSKENFYFFERMKL